MSIGLMREGLKRYPKQAGRPRNDRIIAILMQISRSRDSRRVEPKETKAMSLRLPDRTQEAIQDIHQYGRVIVGLFLMYSFEVVVMKTKTAI